MWFRFDSLIPPANDDTLLPGEEVSVPFVFQANQSGAPVAPTHYKTKLISGDVGQVVVPSNSRSHLARRYPARRRLLRSPGRPTRPYQAISASVLYLPV